jgi:hypothetical protein
VLPVLAGGTLGEAAGDDGCAETYAMRIVGTAFLWHQVR